LLEAHLEEYVWALKKQEQREGDRLGDRARETERKKQRGRRTENVFEPLKSISASATDLWLTGSIDAQEEEEEVLIMERMTCDPYLCLMNLRHKYLHEVEEAEEVRRSSLLASHHTSTVGVELEKVVFVCGAEMCVLALARVRVRAFARAGVCVCACVSRDHVYLLAS
jgi:hypothetical protein